MANCKYRAMYNGKETVIEAEGLWPATQKARDHFKPPKSKQHMVHCTLIELDGEPVSLFNSNAELG